MLCTCQGSWLLCAWSPQRCGRTLLPVLLVSQNLLQVFVQQPPEYCSFCKRELHLKFCFAPSDLGNFSCAIHLMWSMNWVNLCRVPRPNQNKSELYYKFNGENTMPFNRKINWISQLLVKPAEKDQTRTGWQRKVGNAEWYLWVGVCERWELFQFAPVWQAPRGHPSREWNTVCALAHLCAGGSGGTGTKPEFLVPRISQNYGTWGEREGSEPWRVQEGGLWKWKNNYTASEKHVLNIG